MTLLLKTPVGPSHPWEGLRLVYTTDARFLAPETDTDQGMLESLAGLQDRIESKGTISKPIPALTALVDVLTIPYDIAAQALEARSSPPEMSSQVQKSQSLPSLHECPHGLAL